MKVRPNSYSIRAQVFLVFEPETRFEMIKAIEIERFSLISSKPFDEVVAGVNAAIGHPDMAEFGRSTQLTKLGPLPS